MELTKILGADNFVLYNYSSASNTKQLTDYYSKRGKAKVVQWALPINVDQRRPRNGNKKVIEIHNFGQLASLNDCLFRIRYNSRFLVVVDLDEFISLRLKHDTTWYDMLKLLPDDKAAYSFRNVFFRKQWVNPKFTFQEKILPINSEW